MKKLIKINPVLISKLRLLVLPLIVIIAVSILSFKLIDSQFKNISQSKKTNNVSFEKLVILEQKAADLENLQNSQLISSFRSIDNLLPSDKNIPYLISVLNQLEIKNNVYFEGLSFKPGKINKSSDEGVASEKEKGYQTMDFILAYAGTEDSSIQFLQDLLKNAPLFSIDSLSITMQEGIANINIDISTYYLPLPKFIGSLDSPLAKLTSSQQAILNKISTFNILAQDFKEAPQGSGSAVIGKSKSIFNY